MHAIMLWRKRIILKSRSQSLAVRFDATMRRTIKIGNGRIPADSISEILEAKDRNAAGPTAHPEGLYLAEVKYD